MKRMFLIFGGVVGLSALVVHFSFGSNVVISPNMNLPVPIVNQAPGPEWANDINSCMSSIDSHDHTPGHGVPISSEAISINSDLSLNGNPLTDVEAVTFDSQSSFSTNQSLYVISPDIYYNDGNGNVVRITQGGSVSGASGTITGLPSGTASASYQAVGGTFRFQSATNTPANITGATVSLAEQVASVTPNQINLKAPSSLAASYNVTFPSSVPSYTSLLSMSTSGGLSTVPYKAPTVQRFTSGSGTYTTPTSPSPLYLKVTFVGGGGGGSGSSTSAAADGGNAPNNSGSTTFGTSLLTATGGAAAAFGNSNPTAGGTATINAPALTVKAVTGGSGGNSIVASAASGGVIAGGIGGANPMGGAGVSGTASSGGGTANTGGGGSGGWANSNGTVASMTAGTGGAAGGYGEAIITSPSATYSYSVGAGGTAGAAGTLGNAGGAGGSGYIVVEEYYQ